MASTWRSDVSGPRVAIAAREMASARSQPGSSSYATWTARLTAPAATESRAAASRSGSGCASPRSA